MLPPRNSTEPPSLTKTTWTTKTVSEGISLTTYEPVPSQTSTHETSNTSQALEPSNQNTVVAPEDYGYGASSIGPLVQSAQEVYKSSLSAFTSARVPPLSSGQKGVSSATRPTHIFETTSTTVHVQSTVLIIASTGTRTGSLTWTAQSATWSSFRPIESGSFHAIPSTNTHSVGVAYATLNGTWSLGRTSSKTVELSPASQDHQTTSVSHASQYSATTTSSAFISGMALNQPGASSVLEGWNRTTSSVGAAFTTRVISDSVYPLAGSIAVNASSYNSGQSPYLFASSTSALRDHQYTATATVGLSSQTRESSATVRVSPSQNEGQIVTTYTTTLIGTQSTTESAAGAPVVPPPLTMSQTTGVAIAGTTGLLIAIVAVLYVARRHRLKSARRSSTGSIYPKIAYLYDPPPDDQPEKSYRSPTLISGGIYTRHTATRNDNRRLYDSPCQGRHSYGGSLPPYTLEAESEGRITIPRPRLGLSEHNGYTYTPAHFTTQHSTNINRHIVSSFGSPTQHAGWQPSSPRSRLITRSASAAQYSILSDISSAACNPQEEVDGAKHPRISTLRSSCSFRSTPRIAEAMHYHT